MATQTLEKKLASLPKANMSFSQFTETFTDVKYYKGGFEPKMSKREASLILGVRYFNDFFFDKNNLIHKFFKEIIFYSKAKTLRR